MSYCQSALSLSVNCFKYPNITEPAFMSDYDFVLFLVFLLVFSLCIDIETGECWWCEREQLLYWMPWIGREQPFGKPLSLTDSTVRVDHNLSKIIEAKRMSVPFWFSCILSLHRDEGMNLFRVGDTPDSMASPASGYSYLSSSNHAAAQFKLPDKLQIVKPLEGLFRL